MRENKTEIAKMLVTSGSVPDGDVDSTALGRLRPQDRCTVVAAPQKRQNIGASTGVTIVQAQP